LKESESKSFLKQERGQTDESLTTERGKTDESLLSLRRKTERETDQKVQSGRQEADEARAQSRTEIDLSRETKSSGSSKSKTRDQQNLETSLQDQREFDDNTVVEERSRMDAAIRQERAQKEAVLTKFLDRERGETDENLMLERKQTDSVVTRSANLLTAELSSHSSTKAALTTRDEFLAIVSHDLRNPIGAVVSCADMLLEDAGNADMNNETRHWIEFMKRNAETSLRLIRDILDMERVTEGKLNLRLGEHSIDALLKDAVESSTHAALAKNIFLRALPSSISGGVICDHDRIAQVLSNLVGNALKFTPEGGSVTLKVEEVDSEMRVSVSDSGPGIPEDQQQNIFGRYTQLANKDRRGLGLGLYISKMLIEAHRGKLWVTSVPPGGSTFCFTLPR
jgi:signal transduction histidine kinase